MQNWGNFFFWGGDFFLLRVIPSLGILHRFQVEETVLDKLKITFGSSTDFFGRIVVYHLGVLGERL